MKKQTMCAMVVMLALGALANPLAWFQGRGAQEGVKVHGNWVIDVRQPDGTLVVHREFKNALTTYGGNILVEFIARTKTPGGWFVRLEAESAASHPCTGDGLATGPRAPCNLTEAIVNGYQNGSDFKNLTLTQAHLLTPPQNGGPIGFRLSGTATAHAAGHISNVATALEVCDGGDESPAACVLAPWSGTQFTATPITAIPVVRGQLIQVTVTISFSS